MPIYDLVDSDVSGRLPEIGRLRKGAPYDPNAGKAPQEIDYFRFVPSNEADTELLALFEEKYGKDPKVIENVYLAYAEVDQSFDAWNKEYVTAGLLRMCDSRNIALEWNEDAEKLNSWMDWEENKRPKCLKLQNKPCNCRAVGTLHLWLPDLQRIGSVVMPTSSINDIKNISGTLQFLDNLVKQTDGNLRQIPMRLSRYLKEITVSYVDKQGVKRRSKQPKHLVKIEPSPIWVSKMMVQNTVSMVAKPDVKQLTEKPEELDEHIELLDGAQPEQIEREEKDLYTEAQAVTAPAGPKMPTDEDLQNLDDMLKKLGFHVKHLKYIKLFTKLVILRPLDNPSELTKDEVDEIHMAAFALVARTQSTDERVKLIDKVMAGFKSGEFTQENFHMLNYIRALDEKEKTVKQKIKEDEADLYNDLPF